MPKGLEPLISNVQRVQVLLAVIGDPRLESVAELSDVESQALLQFQVENADYQDLARRNWGWRRKGCDEGRQTSRRDIRFYVFQAQLQPIRKEYPPDKCSTRQCCAMGERRIASTSAVNRSACLSKGPRLFVPYAPKRSDATDLVSRKPRYLLKHAVYWLETHPT